jgi:hypothetical protein
MDHAEARELLELAAVEPHGFERLMAGDTPEAAALAGHLAGCESCADEMARLRRAAGVIREVVRTTPPPDLREQTLAFVRDVGRDRSTLPAAVAVGGQALGSAAAEGGERHLAALRGGGPGSEQAAQAAGAGSRGFGSRAWLGAIAATLIVSVAATGFIVKSQSDDQSRRQATTVEQLARVTSWYIGIEAQADAQRIALSSPSGGDATGTVEFSPSNGQLVVVANGLVEPPAGQQLGCWIEVDGARRPIGRMFFGGGLAYWAGPVAQLAGLERGAKFGVTSPVGDTVLVGQL